MVIALKGFGVPRPGIPATPIYHDPWILAVERTKRAQFDKDVLWCAKVNDPRVGLKQIELVRVLQLQIDRKMRKMLPIVDKKNNR